MKPAAKAFGCTMGVFAIVFFALVAFAEPTLVQLLFILVFGWVNYLIRTLPVVEWNWEAIASGAAFLLVSVAGLHLVARSIAGTRGRAWQWKWSLCFTLLFMLVFGVSLVAGGVAHQVDRLAKEPSLYTRRSESLRDVSNVRKLVLAVKNFSADNVRYPARLEELLNPHYIDPSENWEATFTQAPRDENELPAPFIYIRGLTESDPGSFPLIIAPRPTWDGSRHIVGRNDGSVAIMTTSDIRKALPQWKEHFSKRGLPLPPALAEYERPKGN